LYVIGEIVKPFPFSSPPFNFYFSSLGLFVILLEQRQAMSHECAQTALIRQTHMGHINNEKEVKGDRVQK
jgi:hypothetical protein